MEEQGRKQIIELIRKIIDEEAFAELKQMPQRLQQRKEEIKKTKAQREEDAEQALFFGMDKNKEIKNQLKLNEDEQRKPKITKQELEQFEKDFNSHMHGSVTKFDKQLHGNKEVVDFPYVNGKPDAFTSGTVSIGSGREITFSMSILNGLKITAADLEITNENKNLLDKLYNLYITIFKTKFGEIISTSI